jgi:HK97 family phage portal protein
MDVKRPRGRPRKPVAEKIAEALIETAKELAVVAEMEEKSSGNTLASVGPRSNINSNYGGGYAGWGRITYPPQTTDRFNNVTDYVKSWELVPVIYSAVQLISNSGAKYDYRLTDADNVEILGPNQNKEEDRSHPFSRLMDNPNPMQSGIEFRYYIYMMTELAGNLLVWLDNVDELNGLPTALWPLPVDRCAPSFTNGVFSGYKFWIGPQPDNWIPLPIERVLHFKKQSPYSIYWGCGTVQALAKVANTDVALSEYTAQFFNQGASLSGVLTSKESLSDPDFERLKREAQSELMGNRNAHKIAVMDNGVEFTPLVQALKDLGIEKLKQLNAEEILMGFGVPPTKLGVMNHAGYKAEEASVTFQEDTMETRVSMVEDTLNRLARRYDKDGNAVPAEEMNSVIYNLPLPKGVKRTGISVKFIMPIKDLIRKKLQWATEAAQLGDLTIMERRALIGSFLEGLVTLDKTPDLDQIVGGLLTGGGAKPKGDGSGDPGSGSPENLSARPTKFSSSSDQKGS